MVHKNIDIPIIVKENRIETDGCRSIVFERPRNFVFESGDWIDVEFVNQSLKGGKTYTLSSSPTEPQLMITFKDGISELKKALAASKPGDKLKIVQYGNDYKFTLNPTKSSTLIAGGVGIAPFRSMLQEMVDLKTKNNVDLIYLNKTAEFVFLAELERYEKLLPGLTITYIVTKGLKKKDKTKALLSAIKTPDQSFYIAGPEGMVEFSEHLLLDWGVQLANIKIDSFYGY